jgi:hypothetical protein
MYVLVHREKAKKTMLELDYQPSYVREEKKRGQLVNSDNLRETRPSDMLVDFLSVSIYDSSDYDDINVTYSLFFFSFKGKRTFI